MISSINDEGGLDEPVGGRIERIGKVVDENASRIVDNRTVDVPTVQSCRRAPTARRRPVFARTTAIPFGTDRDIGAGESLADMLKAIGSDGKLA